MNSVDNEKNNHDSKFKFFCRIRENLWNRYYSKMVFIHFWFLGFCNSIPFLMMLSAAHDFLKTEEKTQINRDNFNDRYDCNEHSTGLVLLIDVIPGTLTKFIVPFFVHKLKYWQRIMITMISASISFLIIGITDHEIKCFIFIGIIFASFATSFGEMTILSLSTFYSSKLSLAGYASGTGASGFISTFIYAFLTSIGMSPGSTILLMLIVPFIMGFNFIMLPPFRYDFSKVNKNDETAIKVASNNEIALKVIGDDEPKVESNHSDKDAIITTDKNEFKFKDKIFLLRHLIKYMIPLFLVYYSEYLINQGLFELLYFKDNDIVPDHGLQYRWYNVIFRFGVFIARSSIRFVQIKWLAIFPIGQILNLIILFTQVLYGYIPYIWIIFIIIYFEGLIGGASYVK
jgi:battenin